MRGWRFESYRHSLAARGIMTRFVPSSGWSRDSGMMYIYEDADGYPVGNASMTMNEYEIRRFYGNRVPSRTAVVHGLKVYRGHEDKGYGRRLLMEMEEHARERRMGRIWVLDVADCTVRRLLELNGYEQVRIGTYDWVPGVIPEIYEKVL